MSFKLSFKLFMTYFISLYIDLTWVCQSREGGVLDKQPGPVPEHQHHVHPLPESTHASRTRSQHQVPTTHLGNEVCLSLASMSSVTPQGAARLRLNVPIQHFLFATGWRTAARR